MFERGIKNGDYRVLNDEGEEAKTEGRGRKAERRRESREGVMEKRDKYWCKEKRRLEERWRKEEGRREKMGEKGVKERTAGADSPQKTENDDKLIFRGLVKRCSRKGL